ncbi:Amidase [Vanrija pseudolonga]|uniref:Amidase n=1 Tax=Vanrija pseudolonga TaxID=143232 RepID=A0AAF0YJW3_9TREE|nr:Amidase [Vanrija pseudolonga]
MSAAVRPDSVSANNPVTSTSVRATLAPLGLALDLSEEEDYTGFLAGGWEEWNKVLAMDDYVPLVDEARFPRTDVHRPSAEDNPHNAWAWKARIEDTEARGGLLKGKTVALKDNIGVKGVPCLLGTDYIQDWVPGVDATVVTRILEAGGTVLGKAVCENLSLWGTSGSSATGPMDNVYAAGYSAGGSSSGTAVLVARGVVDLGVGGDQGGSIRMPAAKNGIVGLKPTWGLVPYTGVASLEATLDNAGPMTRTVLDNALLLQVIAGADGIDDRQQAGCPFPADVPDYPAIARTGIKGLRVGLLVEGFNHPGGHDPRVSALVKRAAEQLLSLGAASVADVSVPMHLDANILWGTIGRLGGASALRGHNGGRRGLALNDLADKMAPVRQEAFGHLFPSTKNSFINALWAGEHMPASLVGKATNLVRKLKDEYVAALGDVDVLLMPTIPFLPKPMVVATSTPAQLMANASGYTRNTSAFNLTGLPALTIPVGFVPSDDDARISLPVGMQIVGKPYDEALLYRVGYAWEQAFDWKSFT